MFGSKPKKSEEHRWYLLPGQGKGARRKRRQQFVAAVVVGVLFAAVLGTLMWAMNERHF